MNDPLVYVLVINWNGRDHVDACFSSLLASTYPHVKFVLVDNGSDDDSATQVENEFGHDPRVQILRCQENRGWSGGNNIGIEAALADQADYIFLLNNDTAVAPDCIAHLVDDMESNPQMGALAPRMVLFDQPSLLNSVGLEMSVIGSAWDRGIGHIDDPTWHEATPVVGVCGGACFLRASVLAQTGFLPEAFEIYLDDLDLCLRIWNTGHSIWTCPRAVVRHKFSATMGSGAWARRKYYLNTRNRFWLMLRNFPPSRLILGLPDVFMGEVRAVGRASQEGAFWKVAGHLRAWLHALAYVPQAVHYRIAQPPQPAKYSFWTLVRRQPKFCPAVVFPEDGWYPAITNGGERLRPMAREATLQIPSGSLRLCLVNCYPDTAAAVIAVSVDGQPLVTMKTDHREELTVEVQEGTLTIHATSLFPATATGEATDTGAWLQIYCNNNPLV